MSSRDEYVSSLKNSFVTLGKSTVMKALLQKVPFLAMPVLNPLTAMFVGWVLKQVVDLGETGVFFMYIDMRVNDQAKDFEAAAYANRAAQLNGTPEEKARAEKQLKISFARFIRLTS